MSISSVRAEIAKVHQSQDHRLTNAQLFRIVEAAKKHVSAGEVLELKQLSADLWDNKLHSEGGGWGGLAQLAYIQRTVERHESFGTAVADTVIAVDGAHRCRPQRAPSSCRLR